jgi:chemotaxis regulatin CheY-phosphate phosphatase CheZ
MLRWLVRASVAGSANSDVKSESSKASRKANDAKRQFDYAKRERDLDKKLAYMADGMSNLAESIDYVSNTTVPLAKVAFAASLLAESIQDNLDNQTKDIVQQIKS